MHPSTFEHVRSKRSISALLAVLALVLSSVLGAATARAAVEPPDDGDCFAFGSFVPFGYFAQEETVEGDNLLGSIVQGTKYDLLIVADLTEDCVEGGDLEMFLDGFSELRLSFRILDVDFFPVDLSTLFVGVDGGVFRSEELTLALPAIGCDAELVVGEAVYCEDFAGTRFEFEGLTRPYFGYAGLFTLELRRDAQLGAYGLEVTATGILKTRSEPNGIGPAVNGAPDPIVLGSSGLLPFEVVSASGGAASGPAAGVVCSPVPLVAGGVVTCSVTGPAGVDIWWTARASDAFAQGPVRIGSDGTGSFQFRVPAGVVGREVFVELVEWNRPVSLGVAGGPVPGRVPAGEGHGVEPLLLASLLLAGAVGLRVRSGRRARGVVAG